MSESKKYLGMYPKELSYIGAGVAVVAGLVLILLHVAWLSPIAFAVAVALFVLSIVLRRREYRPGSGGE